MLEENLGAITDQAWALVEANRLEEARALFARLCELDESDPESWMMLGTLNAEFDDVASAVSCLEKAIALDSNYADAHFNLAKVLLKLDQPDSAQRHCRVAVTCDPEYADAWQLLGVIQNRLGDHLQAETSSRRAIELDPGNASTHANLGLVLWKLDKLEEAVTCYQDALKLDPQLVEGWSQLGAVYTNLNLNAEAEACYRKVIGIVPTQGEAYARLGSLLLLRRVGEAIESFQRAVQLRPDDAWISLQLGWALQGLGRWDEALDCFHTVARLDPSSADAHFGLGAIYGERGKHQEALTHLEHALRLDPSNDQIQFHVARLSGKSAPSTAPANYIRNLFDLYAERFDSHLVGELAYRGPELTHKAVMDIIGPVSGKRMDVLDLGCGTGLCAPLFRAWASRMTGVDLSERMIEVARARNLYDRLVVGDIREALKGNLDREKEKYDLIIAADVFIYVGALEQVFDLCANSLERTGLFAFTIEASKEGTGFCLRSSGRYAHTSDYVRALASASGLEELAFSPAILRFDRGHPVNGYVIVLRRPL